MDNALIGKYGYHTPYIQLALIAVVKVNPTLKLDVVLK